MRCNFRARTNELVAKDNKFHLFCHNIVKLHMMRITRVLQSKAPYVCMCIDKQNIRVTETSENHIGMCTGAACARIYVAPAVDGTCSEDPGPPYILVFYHVEVPINSIIIIGILL